MPRPSPSVALLLCVLGALATDAAFPGRSWWPLAPVGIALLLLALRGASVPRALGYGWVWGAVFFLVHLWWAEEAAGGVPWLLLGLAEACFVAVFAGAWVLARRWGPVARHPALGALAVASLWVATETVRGLAPFGGLPWGKLAFSQTTGPLLRLASLGGETLVSGVVVATGAFVALALTHLRRARVGRASGAVLVAAALVGVGLVVPVDTRAETGTLRVGAVQGNVPGPGLDAFAVRRDVLERHVTGTEALLAQVEPGELDVVLWPENSTDIDPRVDAEAGRLVGRAAAAVDAPILVGGQRYTGTHRYNEAILWAPGEGQVDVYAKQHPAPFAEYIPLRDIARMVTDAVDLVSIDMLPGDEVGVIALDSPRLGRVVELAVGICFEVAYADLIRDAVLAGGEVLVVPTNNASFGFTQESTQQLAMSVFRAVEHGRATVQISTVGVSGVISPNGVVTESSELFTADRFVAALPLRTSLTVADRLGVWPTVVVGAFAAVTVVAGAVVGAGRRRTARRRSS
ncbi:apolipoprotein N-acyltransferase [uncultured Georgenia sp.]|uniref:apolipoprotein N-acyltransferase n=1 Tax=uncultured Georgenia sp. TaxID=378209 RepID=UPI002632494E|nr:apolipoprotein N-acyltransferase [uncultured Georgenia sp.]HLV05458.1 apolipoprotein N-acyltransferase [Actinomycetaceae bacterium]